MTATPGEVVVGGDGRSAVAIVLPLDATRAVDEGAIARAGRVVLAALGLSLTCSLAGSNMTDTVRVFWVYIAVLLAGLLVVAFVPGVTVFVLRFVPIP